MKKKYELLAYKIFEELKSKEAIVYGEKHNWECDNQTIFVNYGMTRAQGLSEIKYKISDNILLVIQIQGEYFRLAIEDNNGIVADRIKEKLLNTKLWFGFDEYFESSDLTIYPTNKDKTFNKYGKVFFYKSIKLGKKFKISELVEIIKIYMKHIDKNFKAIDSLAEKEDKHGS